PEWLLQVAAGAFGPAQSEGVKELEIGRPNERNGKQFRQWDDVLRLDEDQAIAEEPARLEGGERGRTSHEAPALTRQRFGARERALEAPLHPEQVVGERVHRPGAGGDESAEREIAAQDGFREFQLDPRG